ncbi:hypothetical protein DL771_003819 [Monosporascus sp. 5C6A]|nr:hypothetical protein DL771_003819 [Monosporascus sp. 5C6A]
MARPPQRPSSPDARVHGAVNLSGGGGPGASAFAGASSGAGVAPTPCPFSDEMDGLGRPAASRFDESRQLRSPRILVWGVGEAESESSTRGALAPDTWPELTSFCRTGYCRLCRGHDVVRFVRDVWLTRNVRFVRRARCFRKPGVCGSSREAGEDCTGGLTVTLAEEEAPRFISGKLRHTNATAESPYASGGAGDAANTPNVVLIFVVTAPLEEVPLEDAEHAVEEGPGPVPGFGFRFRLLLPLLASWEHPARDLRQSSLPTPPSSASSPTPDDSTSRPRSRSERSAASLTTSCSNPPPPRPPPQIPNARRTQRRPHDLPSSASFCFCFSPIPSTSPILTTTKPYVAYHYPLLVATMQILDTPAAAQQTAVAGAVPEAPPEGHALGGAAHELAADPADGGSAGPASWTPIEGEGGGDVVGVIVGVGVADDDVRVGFGTRWWLLL